jgi:hypothetical protein
MRILNLLICGAVMAFLSSGVSAQKFLSKPWTEWSKDEALSLLADSGWAKTYSSIEGGARAEAGAMARSQRDSVNRGGGNPGSASRDLGNLPITIRLHSSPFVRQAMVRLQQINVKYDKMSDEEKAKFDASRKGYLECPICKDYYVVTITKYTDSSGETINEGIFQSMTVEDMKGGVSLVNDKGESRELVQFTPPKTGTDPAIFFFKRTDDAGNPLVGIDAKELRFVFSNEFVQRDKRYSPLYPRRFEFPVSKMTISENVLF